MKKKILLIILCIFLCSFLLYIVDLNINPHDGKIEITREQQHVVAMKNGADPKLGLTKLPKDFVVNKKFKSHLPLVIIDIEDREIPITKKIVKKNNDDWYSEVIRTGEDPYVKGNIKIIDNKNYINSLGDSATKKSDIKIRYRGNSSLRFEKKQYAIKLIDKKGKKKKMSFMGMESNNDWILNISMQDSSLIRNYMAYNLGSSIFEYTPEAKYCEVFFKKKGEYEYKGLYLMMEKIEKGKGRVDISSYKSGDKSVSYLLCRDRKDNSKTQLKTYGSENNITYGRISVLYPDSNKLDEYALSYIQKDIDKVDRVLYSGKIDELLTWQNYLDSKSFVDYFLFNEILGNYDAGDNSTYFYKDRNGKLTMGPIWDYDGAMDNYSSELSNPEYIVFYKKAWFEQLIKTPDFIKLLKERYIQLKGGNFSSKEIGKYVDDISKFLGNAAQRDWCRWEAYYGKNSGMSLMEDDQGFSVNNTRYSQVQEAQRLKDFISMKEMFLGDSIQKLEDELMNKEINDGLSRRNIANGSYLMIVFIVLFICSVVLIRRYKFK